MKLTVITKKFPYYTTEAFLESELNYLERAFDEVVFVPIIKGPLRKISSVRINDAYNKLYKKKIYQCICLLFSKPFYHQLFMAGRKFFDRNYFIKIVNQEIHYCILKKIVKNNFELFDENCIVYCYWFSSSVYGLLKLKSELHLKCKIVCRAHRYDVYDETGEMPNRAYCIEKIDQIFPISQNAIDTFTEKYGCIEKYTLARLGVKNFNIVNTPSVSGLFHVLSVSQTSKRKRIPLILSSLKQFANDRKDIQITWTHFGDGPLDKFLLSESQNNDIVNFRIEVMGRVPNLEIIDYYKKESVDLFVNLSESEGVPVSVMEAHSFGVPVVATNVGGTSEIMDKANGVLLSSDPSIEEVVKAYSYIYESHLDRAVIRTIWNTQSNSDVVFPEFVKKLKRV